MKTILKLFAQGFASFSRQHPWVFVVIACALFLTFIVEQSALGSLFLVLTIHASGDVCISIMLVMQAQKEFRKAVIFQIVSGVFFMTLAIRAFVVDDQPQYLLFQIPFLLVGLKSVFEITRTRYQYVIVPMSMLFVNFILVILLFFVFLKTISAALVLQSIGFVGFSTVLSMQKTNRAFPVWTLIVLGFMVLGSVILVVQRALVGKIDTVTITYCIFPMTVFVVNLDILMRRPKRTNTFILWVYDFTVMSLCYAEGFFLTELSKIIQLGLFI